MTQKFLKPPVPDACPECEEKDCVVWNHDFYCYECGTDFDSPEQIKTPQEAMAVAVLEGDTDAALALADEVQMAYHHGPNYVSRQQLLHILEDLFEYVDRLGDGEMEHEEIKVFQKLQRAGELTNFKTLNRLLLESREDIDAEADDHDPAKSGG